MPEIKPVEGSLSKIPMDTTPSEFFFKEQNQHNITLGELIDFVSQEATKKVVANLKDK